MKPTALIAHLLLSTAIVVPAALSLAAPTSATNTNQVQTAPAAATQWLSIAQVHSQLEAAGYRNIEKIERERGSYEVKATNRDGQRVKLYVHPQTGTVLDTRTRKDKREGASWGWGGVGKPGVECNERRCRDDLPAAAGGRP